MTKEEYFDLQEDYINHILEYVKESGGLFPHISIFADIIKPKKEERGKPALIHIPIDDDFMKDEESKDYFVDVKLPQVFKELKKDFVPVGIAWAAEAWMRVLDKDPDYHLKKDNWKALPIKKEVIMINIESKDYDKKVIIYEIKRKGKQINPDGNLVDIVELEILEDMANPTEMDGRFSGLLKKFNN